jgi:hypothetical protein
MLIAVIPGAEPWSSVLTRLADLGRASGQGAFNLLVAVVVVLVGWAVAALLARVLRGVLRALRFDDGVRRVLGAHATTRHEPVGVAAWVVYWLVMAGAAMVALEVLGFSLATSVAARLGEVVPRIVTSAVLFAVGSLVAMLIGGITRRFLESADIRAARLQGQVVSAVLTGFAALLALEQLGFAAQFVMGIGIVGVAAAGLGLALAFGLGCRDLARDFVVEYLRSIESDDPKRPV